MEPLSDNSHVLKSPISLPHLASGLQSDDVVTFNYDKSEQTLSYEAPDFNHKDCIWDHVCRFMTYYYNKHMLAPRHAPWCRDGQTLLPAAAQMVLFDDNSWLVTRLTPRPVTLDHPWLGLPLTAIGINKIYSAYMDWRRRDAAELAVVQHRGGKPRGRRVRLAPDDHVVSVFEGGSTDKTTTTTTTAGNCDQDTLFVIMELDCDGELTFYYNCLHCPDLTCGQCIEVLENVAASGRRHTRACGPLPC